MLSAMTLKNGLVSVSTETPMVPLTAFSGGLALAGRVEYSTLPQPGIPRASNTTMRTEILGMARPFTWERDKSDSWRIHARPLRFTSKLSEKEFVYLQEPFSPVGHEAPP